MTVDQARIRASIAAQLLSSAYFVRCFQNDSELTTGEIKKAIVIAEKILKAAREFSK